MRRFATLLICAPIAMGGVFAATAPAHAAAGDLFVTVDTTATITSGSGDEQATFTGTASCTGGGEGELVITASQAQPIAVAFGTKVVTVSCNGTVQNWTANVTSTSVTWISGDSFTYANLTDVTADESATSDREPVTISS